MSVSHVLPFTVLILKMRSVGIKVRSSISAHDQLGSSVCYSRVVSTLRSINGVNPPTVEEHDYAIKVQ